MDSVRSGLKTTELWITVAGGFLMQFVPDFPQEGLWALGSWVVTRGAQKGFGLADGKRAWMTTEFWGTIILSAVMAIFPDFPKEPVLGLIAYIGSRFFSKKKPAAATTTT